MRRCWPVCRRCGEPDRRGSAVERRRRRTVLLTRHGNGIICPCYWCAVLVAATPGRVHIRESRHGIPGIYLPVLKLEQDRLQRGGPYALWNLVPSCPPCNKGRDIMDEVVPLGCTFGGRPRLDLADEATG